MPIGKKQARRIVDRLEDVLTSSTMERSDFESLHSEIELPKSQKEVTAFVKDRTEHYRRSWLTEPLQEIIKKLKEFTE